MLARDYERLQQRSFDDPKESLPYDGDIFPPSENKTLVARPWKTIHTLLALLGFSIAANILLLAWLRNALRVAGSPSIAGLERNIPTEIVWERRDLDDPLWDAPEYDAYAGYVRFDKDYAKAKDLPDSQTWPWDNSKSFYIMQSFHSLHCVNVIRDALRQFRDREDQLWPLEHVTHCLHTLREDTICHADDTPLYTGGQRLEGNKTQPLPAGIGQKRMCRDWSKLRQFSVDRSACYFRPVDHYIPVLERFKKCPDGSKPWLQGTTEKTQV